MKLFTLTAFSAIITTLVSGTPFPDSAFQLLGRDTEPKDCDFCKGFLYYCFDNGFTGGQDGCKQTCSEHVCHFFKECKQCGEEFSKCPDAPRWG